MDVRVLRTFCDIVETGSFSMAAKANGISQPAVSQQLASLERAFHAQLVTRGGRTATPTDAGRAFYTGAKAVLRRYAEMVAQVAAAVDAVGGVLRVGTIYSVGLYLLDPYVRAFLKAHPEVDLRVEYTHWSRVRAAVLDGDMDLGVVAYPEKHRSIEVIPLVKEELVVVCSPEHRIASRDWIAPKDLSSEEFIAFESQIPTRVNIDRLLRAARVKVRIAMEFDNIETLKRAVEINAGLSILPRGNVEREVADGRLSCAALSHPRMWARQIGIIRRRGRTPSRAERMFLGLLRGKL